MAATRIADLAAIIDALESKGRLARVKSEVDPRHELAGIAHALAGGSRAVLFESVKGHRWPVLAGLAAAIVMLADGVEAAARTLKDRSQERLLELIRRIVSAASEDGQFSDCEITLAELERITFSFLETLSRFYHGRITYPGFDFGGKTADDAKAATS